MPAMSLQVSRTANFAQHAYRAWAPSTVRRPMSEPPGAGRETPAIRVQQVGYVGLERAVAPYHDFRPGSPALLTALIHSMGGAATSVASGIYLDSRV